MRNLFLGLLLANFLFAGWRLWIAPADVPSRQIRAAGREPELRVAMPPSSTGGRQGRGEAGGAAVAPPAGTPAAGGADCARVGPIADGQVADSLRATLAGRGVQASAVAEEGQVWVGHWVQLESVGTREEADRMAERLAAGGVSDAYVFQSAPPFFVSLGVFRDKERADKVAAAAASLGFRPQVTDRYRAGTQYWLVLPSAAAGDLRLEELGQKAGQILRVEAVACRPAAVGAAGGE